MYVIQSGPAPDPKPPASLGKEKRNPLHAMSRGMRGACPACGRRRLFAHYLKVADTCAHCGEELHHHRADDAPPYFTILIVGHIVVPLLLAVELTLTPPVWVHMAIWLPLTVALCLVILPMVKGTFVGLQWALYMHGFDPDARKDDRSDAEDH